MCIYGVMIFEHDQREKDQILNYIIAKSAIF